MIYFYCLTGRVPLDAVVGGDTLDTRSWMDELILGLVRFAVVRMDV